MCSVLLCCAVMCCAVLCCACILNLKIFKSNIQNVDQYFKNNNQFFFWTVIKKLKQKNKVHNYFGLRARTLKLYVHLLRGNAAMAASLYTLRLGLYLGTLRTHSRFAAQARLNMWLVMSVQSERRANFYNFAVILELHFQIVMVLAFLFLCTSCCKSGTLPCRLSHAGAWQLVLRAKIGGGSRRSCWTVLVQNQ